MKRRTGSSMVTSNELSTSTKQSVARVIPPGGKQDISLSNDQPQKEQNDGANYALLIALYTLQGIPMGLSASIPFLIQQKIKLLTQAAASATAASATATAASGAATASAIAASASRMSYNANAIFALCSWPFSLKLLWAPIVDAVFFKSFGRRKSWLVPVQLIAGLIMVLGSDFVENQLGLGSTFTSPSSSTSTIDDASAMLSSMNVKGLTIYFFSLYFLMATQDIAVDGWALTMLSKKNRGRGPVCNSIGQNIGYFLSFVGFLALNDPESCNTIWRPLLRLPKKEGEGLVSLGGFIRFMGVFMLSITTVVAIFKREKPITTTATTTNDANLAFGLETLLKKKKEQQSDDDDELDASEIGLKETYRRLWAVCKLPSVQWLFLILFSYRFPVSLSDNVKFLKAVEYGMSKSITALLSPTLILPIGILVPIVAAKIWHGHPLRQFMQAYKLRVTLVPLFDILMLFVVKNSKQVSTPFFWLAIIASTGLQAICNSLQFNSQMMFFASRVDPAIGGTYMTLLNTAANMGGTWPSSFVMYLMGAFSSPADCAVNSEGIETCVGGRDAYVPLQIALSVIGLAWIAVLGGKVKTISELPDEAWRTNLLDQDLASVVVVPDVESNNSNSKTKDCSKRE